MRGVSGRVLLMLSTTVVAGLVILAAIWTDKLAILAPSVFLTSHYPVNSVDVNRSNIIFYNRVPKCASTTTYTIMKNLASKNHFVYKLYHHYPLTYFYRDPKEEERLVDSEFERLKKLKKKVLAIEHLFFKDFSKSKAFVNESLPIYINLIREPLERLQSWHYYIRYQPNHIRKLSEEKRTMNYSDCVLRNDPECTHSDSYMSQISFFCGPMTHCRLPRMGALEQAKQNVLHHYAVVGVMEQLRDFYLALEWKFPQWFSGATDIYDKFVFEEKSLKNKLVTIPHSRELHPKAEAIMKELLKEEYDFYFFIKQQFAIMIRQVQAEMPQHIVNQPLHLDSMKAKMHQLAKRGKRIKSRGK